MQELPRWGVMFYDGSVRSCWNGRTQLQRATEYLKEYYRKYGEDTSYPVTLAYREEPGSPWVRVTPDTKEGSCHTAPT